MLNEVNQKDIGKRIRQAREENKMTQRELASKIEMSDSQLSSYENGKKSIGLYTLAKIANATNKTIDELYFGNDEVKPLTKSTSTPELIVNCLDALFENGVIQYNGMLCKYDKNEEEWNYEDCISVIEYETEIYELLQNLEQFEQNEDSYPDPQLFKKQLLASTANKIKKQMGRE